VILFIFWYFPQLGRVQVGLIRLKLFPDKRRAALSSPTWADTYFGPLRIIPGDPGVSSSIVKGHLYDLTLTVALEKVLRPGMSVINVGANIGYFAALAAKRTRAPVICVEPDPRCVEVLRQNQAIYKELRIFPFVASDRLGTETFTLNAASTGDSSITSSAVGTTRQFPANTLDNIVGKAAVDVMVIDAQGAEPKIFAGSTNVLQKLSMIFFEFWPYGLELAGFQPEALLALLHSRGFRLSHFFPSFHPDPQANPSWLVGSLKSQDHGMGFCNLLATKVERGSYKATR
jgi:FkbM family methyltransferase